MLGSTAVNQKQITTVMIPLNTNLHRHAVCALLLALNGGALKAADVTGDKFKIGSSHPLSGETLIAGRHLNIEGENDTTRQRTHRVGAGHVISASTDNAQTSVAYTGRKENRMVFSLLGVATLISLALLHRHHSFAVRRTAWLPQH
jgi:hypothetical protein